MILRRAAEEREAVERQLDLVRDYQEEQNKRRLAALAECKEEEGKVLAAVKQARDQLVASIAEETGLMEANRQAMQLRFQQTVAALDELKTWQQQRVNKKMT
jgi:hypothetical protein